MDRKAIIVLILCFGLLLLWTSVIVPALYPPKPLPPGATNAPAATVDAPSTNPAAVSATPPPAPTTQPAPSAVLAVNTNVPEQLIVLSNESALYTFTSYGGGLKTVGLVQYPETVRRGPDGGEGMATLNAAAAVPTLAILDGEAVQGDGIFELSEIRNGVRAEKDLTNGLRIVKEFILGTNYLISATVSIANRSDEAVSLPAQHWMIGTATPMNPEDNGKASVGLMWRDGEDIDKMLGASHFATQGFLCMPRTPPTEFRTSESNIVWAAVYNQFFTLAAMPQEPAAQVVAFEIDLPPPSAEELREHPDAVKNPKGYPAALVYPAVTLAPDEELERQFQLFAGPKEYQTLARIAARFDNEIDAVMDFGWFGFFSKALLLSMNKLHTAFSLSYGWSIIVITIIIKTLFWPLTAASTRSMKRMSALQPQMKALQEKYRDDPPKMNRKMMEFMRENKVNPMGGCLPMLLQMPVFIGFFYMIRSAIELRGASFLWVADLSRPDTLFYLPGINFPFNLLPLLMGATMLWQSHLTPPSPGMDPMQQKILRYMPLIFVLFLYNFSAGLTLYWTVQNLLTIAQTKLTKTATDPKPAPKAPALTTPPKKRK